MEVHDLTRKMGRIAGRAAKIALYASIVWCMYRIICM